MFLLQLLSILLPHFNSVVIQESVNSDDKDLNIQLQQPRTGCGAVMRPDSFVDFGAIY